MKNKLLKFSLFAFVLFMLVSLTGCSILKETSERAKNTTNEFFNYVTSDDYEGASTMLHPDGNINASNLDDYLLSIEESCNIDFSNGFKINSTTSINIQSGDNDYDDGTVYEVNYKTTIDGKYLDLYIIIVDNDNGFGVYYFTID